MTFSVAKGWSGATFFDHFGWQKKGRDFALKRALEFVCAAATVGSALRKDIDGTSNVRLICGPHKSPNDTHIHMTLRQQSGSVYHIAISKNENLTRVEFWNSAAITGPRNGDFLTLATCDAIAVHVKNMKV